MRWVLLTVTAVTLAVAASQASGSGRARPVGAAGVVLRVPDSWRSIPMDHPTLITEPVTRVVVGSGRIGLGRGCNDLDYALAPGSVAIVILEWLDPTPGTKWKLRPRHFNSVNLPVRPGLVECFKGSGGSAQFVQHGRRFAAFVLARSDAPPKLITRARTVLDTLTVTRR